LPVCCFAEPYAQG